MSNNDIIGNYHSDALQSFRNYKKLAEKAIEQIDDEQFFEAIDSESNSVAVIVKHVAGNLLSRWADFLTSDGEKDFRDRDAEFEKTGGTRESLMKFWEDGWQTLFENIEPFTVEDFLKSITIRGEPHTIVEAMNRQLTHYAYHIGQIVFLAKHLRSAEWQNLSVPKNRSGQFNQFLADKQKEGVEKLDRMEAAGIFAEDEKEKSGPV
ncbi:MAG: DUF1572 family protein [Acidobacteriota bacterium]